MVTHYICYFFLLPGNQLTGSGFRKPVSGRLVLERTGGALYGWRELVSRREELRLRTSGASGALRCGANTDRAAPLTLILRLR